MFTPEKRRGSILRSCGQWLYDKVKPSLSPAVTPSAACPMGPWPLSSVCPWAPGLPRGKLMWGRAPQTRQRQPGSTGTHRPVGMLQSRRADGDPREASTYWEYPSFENRNMEMIKLNGKLVRVLLPDVAARGGHGAGVSPRCVHRQGVCRPSHPNLPGAEKRKG